MENERDPLRKIPIKHAPEPKADIGALLRAAREKRGHTLETVSQQTRISRRYLEALEKNQFDEFPAIAYLRGFLKSYCDFLEIEFEPVWRMAVAESKHEDPASEQAPAPAAAPRAVPAPTSPAPAPRAGAPHAAAPSYSAAQDSAAPVAVLILCLLLLGSATWLVRRPGQASQLQQPALPAALAPVRSQTQSKVVLEFRDEVWISVNIDGKPLFEGRAPKASKQEWPIVKDLALRVVNPQALKVLLNNSAFKLPNPDAQGVYHIQAP